MTIWEDRFSDRQAPTGGTSKWIPQLGVRGFMPPGVRHRWGACASAMRLLHACLQLAMCCSGCGKMQCSALCTLGR